MKTQKVKNVWFLMVLMTSLLLVFTNPGAVRGAGIPSPKDVVGRKAKCPTIEDLTNGKVKKGDIIDKNNMDLVKEYLTEGNAEAIRQGMVLVIGTTVEPDVGNIPAFTEATKKYRGKAIIDENGVVYCEKMGVKWPGGIPFPEPKTGNEVMANAKYGIGLDDFHTVGKLFFVNSKGVNYKTIHQENYQIWMNTRSIHEPLGSVKGYEDQMWRRTSVLTYPIEIKGQGQFVVRHYDDTAKYDAGFMYFPAFKRTLRISATTWQDNIGGSDLTHGDAQGLNEPYSYWNFKLIGTKYVLMPERIAPFTYFHEDGNFDPKMKWDVGRRWPRFGWAILPMHVVEATPRIKHIYARKVLYVSPEPWAQPAGVIETVDIYDRQNKLWKWYCPHSGYVNKKWDCTYPWGIFMADLQAKHTTQFWFYLYINENYKPTRASFKQLLKQGR